MKILTYKCGDYEEKLPLNRALSESFYGVLICVFGNEMMRYCKIF